MHSYSEGVAGRVVGETHLHDDDDDDDHNDHDDHNDDDDGDGEDDDYDDDDDDDDDEESDQELAQLLLDWRVEGSPELRLRRKINLLTFYDEL